MDLKLELAGQVEEPPRALLLLAEYPRVQDVCTPPPPRETGLMAQ